MKPEKIRLVEFVTNFNIGGTERQVINLARGLDPDRFDIHFACFGRSGVFLRDIPAHTVGVAEFKINRLYNHTAIREQIRFAQYLRRNKIEIVHAYGFYANVFSVPAAKLAGTPVVIASVRDTGDPLTPMQRRVQRVICRRADWVLANSDAVRRSVLAEGYAPHRVSVIRNGILTPEMRNGTQIRDEFRLPETAPLVAVLSRLNRLKGIEYFLQAAARVLAVFENVRFLVVGDTIIDAPYRKDLEAYAARLGLNDKVIFTGFRTDVGSILSQITVSVLPSMTEGLSNVLLESMAMGVPVVATDVGGNPEAVQNGVTGTLVQPRDDAALAEAICSFLQNPDMAARFGEAGKRRIAELFSVERMVDDTERLYANLLSAKNTRLRNPEVAHA